MPLPIGSVASSSDIFADALLYLDAGKSSDAVMPNFGKAGSSFLGSAIANPNPIFLKHTGTNYLHLPLTNGNCVALPSNPAINAITGDIELVGRMKISSQTNAIALNWIAKGIHFRSYIFQSGTTFGKVGLWVNDGTTSANVASSVPLPPQFLNWVDPVWVKITRRISDGRVQFFYSPDKTTEPTSGEWIQLGSNQTLTLPISSSNNAVYIGTYDGTNEPFSGNIYRVIVRNGIDGPTVYDIDFTTAIQNGAQWSVPITTPSTFTKSNAYFVSNLGTGGAVLDARRGSSAVVDTNEPEWLDHAGTNYLYLSGIVGNHASIPDDPTFDISNTVEIVARVALDSWTGGTQAIVDNVSSFAGWGLRVSTGGALIFPYGQGGASYPTPPSSSQVPPLVNGTTYWLKATFQANDGAGNNVARFFYSADSSVEPVSWTEIGTPVVTVGATSITPSSQVVSIGGISNGISQMAAGKFFRIIVRNGIGGSPVIDADFTGITSGGQTSLTAITGQTVAINRSAAGRKAVAVTRPCWLFGGDDYFEINNNSLLNFSATESLTALVIFRQWATPVAFTTLIGKQSTINNTSAGWQLYQQGGGPPVPNQLASEISDGTTAIYSGGVSPSYTLGQLSLGATVVDRTNQTIVAYMNATATSSTPTTTIGSLVNSNNMRIGSGPSPGDTEMFGAAVWRRALSDSEIALVNNHYNGTVTPESTALLQSAVFWIDAAQSGQSAAILRATVGRKSVAVTKSVMLMGQSTALAGGNAITVPANPLDAAITFNGASGSFASATAASTLISGTAGTTFLSLPRDAPFGYAYAVSSASVAATGNLELVCRVALDKWVPSSSNILMSKGYGGEFWWNIDATAVGFLVSVGGVVRSVTVPWAAGSRPANGVAAWLKVTKTTAGVVTFYSAADSTSEPTVWTTIGTGTNALLGTSDVTTNLVGFGAGMQTPAYQGGERMAGKYYRGILRTSIGGAAVIDADFTGKTIGATSFTATTGGTITLGNSARIVDETTYLYVSNYPSNASGASVSAPDATSLRIQGNDATHFLALPGTATHYASALSGASTTFNVTGDIEIVCRVSLDDWTPSQSQALVSKWDNTTNNRSYSLNVLNTTLALYTSSNGLANGASEQAGVNISAIFVDGTTYWIKVTKNTTTGVTTFYYAADAATEPTVWTTIGAPTMTYAGGAFSGNAPIEIGSVGIGSTFNAAGKFYRTIVRNGIAGAAVFDVNWTSTTYAIGATSVTATTGGTVNINGLLAEIVDGSTYLYLDGVSTTWATIPHSISLQLTGDRTLIVDVALAKWARVPGDTYGYLISKRVGSTGEWWLRVDPNNSAKLNFVWYQGGVQRSALSSVAPTVADGGRIQIAVTQDMDNGAGSTDVRFFTRLNDSASWSQLGTTITLADGLGVAVPDPSTNLVAFGAEGYTGGQNTSLRMYRAQMLSGTGASFVPGGTRVADFQFDRQISLSSTILDSSGSGASVTFVGTGSRVERNRDIEIVCRAGLDNWIPASRQTLVSKYNSLTAQRSYALTVNTTGALMLQWSTNGAAAGASEIGSSAPALTNGVNYWLKATVDIDDGNGNSIITFYKANDQATEPSTWTTISTHTVTGGLSFYPGTAAVAVGAWSDFTQVASGRIYRSIVRNGIAATSTVFDAEFSRQVMFGTSFVDRSSLASTVTIAGPSTRIERNRDMEIIARVSLPTWIPPSGGGVIVGKRVDAGAQQMFSYRISSSGHQFYYSMTGGGATTVTSTSFPPLIDGNTYWLKVAFDSNNGSGGNTTSFFWAPDQPGEPLSTTWTPYSSVVTAGTVSLFPATTPLEIGSRNLGVNDLSTATFKRVILRNNTVASTTTVADFEASSFSKNGTRGGERNLGGWFLNGAWTLTNPNPLNFAASDKATILVIFRQWANYANFNGPFAKRYSSTNTYPGWGVTQGNVGNMYLESRGGGTTDDFGTPPSVISYGQLSWYAAVKTGTGTGNIQYLNGTTTTSNDALIDWSNSEPVYVGRTHSLAGNTDFEIFTLAIWDRALSANDLATVFARNL